MQCRRDELTRFLQYDVVYNKEIARFLQYDAVHDKENTKFLQYHVVQDRGNYQIFAIGCSNRRRNLPDVCQL